MESDGGVGVGVVCRCKGDKTNEWTGRRHPQKC